MLSSHFLLPTFYTPWQATVWEVIANFGRNRNTLPSASEPELHRAHLAAQSLGRRQVGPQDMKVPLTPQALN